MANQHYSNFMQVVVLPAFFFFKYNLSADFSFMLLMSELTNPGLNIMNHYSCVELGRCASSTECSNFSRQRRKIKYDKN